MLTSDFGDAPDTTSGTGAGNYQTLSANGGPSHVIDATQATLFLGARVDGEANATQNARANGDDITTSPDDEDGLLEPAQDLLLTAGSAPAVRVRATNTTGAAATLYGWIDINRNGVFDNATERSSVAVPSGTNKGTFTLTFPSIPANTVGGATYARFRLSTDATAANSTGAATGGEVEDYIATIFERGGGSVERSKNIQIQGIGSGSGFEPLSALASLGDFDGDGVSDLAVGDSYDGYYAGSVSVLLLNSNGSVKSTVKIESNTNGGPTLESAQQSQFGFREGGDRFGNSIAVLGDLDGDGVSDLAVGAYTHESSGAVYMLYLNANGTAKRSVRIANNENGGPTLEQFVGFGASVASLGDLDGDGVGDLAVGALSSDNSSGAIHILRLNANGTVKSSSKLASPMFLDGETVLFGQSMTPLGDLDNDGISDLAVGGRYDSASSTRGAVYVLRLNADGSLKSSTAIAQGLNGGPANGGASDTFGFGCSVASLGDLNGDGITDLLAGDFRDPTGITKGFNTVGAVHLLLLNSNGSVKSSNKIASDTNGGPTLTQFRPELQDFEFNLFGYSATSLGDLDGDGVIDLAVADIDGIHILHLKDLATASAPSISPIPGVSVKGSSASAIEFTVSDLQTPASNLTLSGTSSNTTLVPNQNIVFRGSGANRTVTVTPATNQTGTANITVTVTDGDGATATEAFDLTVTSNAGFSFDFQAVASNLHPTLRFFGQTSLSAAPFQIVRYGKLTLSSLTGFPLSLAAAGNTPENITIEFGSSNPASPVEVISLGSFNNGLSTGTGKQIFVPNGTLAPGGTQTDIPTVKIFNSGVAVAQGVFLELDLNVSNLGRVSSTQSRIQIQQALGSDPTIFNEIMAKTGNGIIPFSLGDFDFGGSVIGFGDAEIFSSTGQGLAGSPPADDHGNAIETSTAWDRQSSVDGTIDSSADADVFAVTLSAGQTYTFGTILGTLGDTTLEVLNSAGTPVAFNDDVSDALRIRSSKVVVTPTASGTYYLVVRGFRESTGTYAIEELVPDDHGDLSDTSTVWDRQSSINGTIDSIADLDVFAVTLSSGQTYTFGTILGTLDDTTLEVLNSAGTQVAFNNDDSASDFSSKVVVTPTASGTYYLVVNGFGQSTGTYTLEERGGAVSPTVTVNIVDSSLNDTDNSSNVTFTFSENVNGFDATDLAALGGTLSAFSGSGSSYSATFTATNGLETTGSVFVGTGYINLTGTSGTAGSDSVAIDTLKPTVIVNIVDASLNNNDNNSSVTFVFSESVTGFTAADVTVGGGTLSAFSGSGSSYSATFTATKDVSSAGTVSVGTGYTDAVGNTGTAGSDTVTIDTLNPTVTVNIVDTSLNDTDNNSSVTFIFNESVTGFTAADITVVGGTLSAFAGSGSSYSATFTATNGIATTGSVTVGTGYTDAVGNTGAAGSDTVAIDTLNPTVIVNVVDTSLNDADNNSSVTFVFSESVTGFTAGDVTVVGGTLTAFAGSGSSYSATFTATNGIATTGSVSVGTGFTDAAGNAGTAGSDMVPIDTLNPTVTVNIVDTSLNDADNNSSVTFVFSESVTGFTAGDVTVVGGALSAFSGSGSNYTATFTATNGIATTGSVAVGTGYTDAVGNTGTTGSDTVAIDTTDGVDVTINLTTNQKVVVQTSGNNLQVLIDDVVNATFSSILAATVQSITVNGGTGANLINLQGVTPAAFSRVSGVVVIVQAAEGDDSVLGSAFGDQIFGAAGNDNLDGGLGNDTLTGGDGVDVLAGGTGTADVLSESTATNLVLSATQLSIGVGGAAVVDVLSGFEKAMLFGGGAANVLDASTAGIPVSMFGGGGNDSLIGGNQADNLDGQAGDDTLTGGAGNDTLNGGAGTDGFRDVAYTDVVAGQVRTVTLTSSSLVVKVGTTTLSADSLLGFEFADLTGGTMRDIINASGFTNSKVTTISGGGGNDVITGTPGADMIFTVTGADSISGGAGSDTIFAGSGNDTINGGDGADNLNGQTGNDSILGDAGNDVLIGGAGIDTMSGGLDNDFLSGQTEASLLFGGDGNDTLQGNTDKDTLNGDAGDDRLYGLQGDDVINAGDGADSLVGAIGNDSLNGGAGLDTLQGDLGNDTLDGGADFDRINEVFDTNVTIVGITVTTTSFGSDTVLAIERIQVSGGAANNFFDARQATVPVFLSGGAGNDTLLGGSKGDGVIGGDGDDVLSGGAGTDIIDGGNGNDYWLEKADTNFTVNGTVITSAVTGSETPTSIERIALIGGTGANKLDATLATVPVVLIGGRGNDTLLGGSGADTLSGGNRNDATVVGGDGADSLDGGAGADTLESDPSDTLIPGSGDTTIADIFTLLPSWIDAL